MECEKRIVNSNDLAQFFSLPRSFFNKRIEVLMTPVEDLSISDSSAVVQECIQDACTRYRIVNGRQCSYKIPDALVCQFNKINFVDKPLFSIRDDSLKVTLYYNAKKYLIDYKNQCPDVVYVSSFRIDGHNRRSMDIKEMSISNLARYFEGLNV